MSGWYPGRSYSGSAQPTTATNAPADEDSDSSLQEHADGTHVDGTDNRGSSSSDSNAGESTGPSDDSACSSDSDCGNDGDYSNHEDHGAQRCAVELAAETAACTPKEVCAVRQYAVDVVRETAEGIDGWSDAWLLDASRSTLPPLDASSFTCWSMHELERIKSRVFMLRKLQFQLRTVEASPRQIAAI
jgi:hypothetical protein